MAPNRTVRFAIVSFLVAVGTGWTLACAREEAATTGSQAKVVLVTGSTSGLGREVALQLAATGAHVIVHGRSVERGNEVVAEIEAGGAGSARFYEADLASLAEVRRFAEAVKRDYDRLDLLVNNAGIASTRSGGRELSADGHELMFAVNYLAGYLLTYELLPLLRTSAPARIVNVSSLGQAPIDFDNVMLERGYEPFRAYAQSKLAQVMFTIDLAAELEGAGVTVNCLHPATMMDTNMVRALGLQPRTSVDEGVAAVMQLAVAEDVGNGLFYDGTSVGRAIDQAYDVSARARLRELSRRLAGVE